MLEPVKRFHDGKRGATLSIRVTPRSPNNELVGILEDGTIKVKIAGAPVDGKANQVLRKFLADILDVPVSDLEIVAGKTSKNKIVAVEGIDPGEIDRRIQAIINKR